LYALAYANSGPLLLFRILKFFYDEDIESRMLQITRIRKIAQGRSGTTGRYTKNGIRKTPTGYRGFLLSISFRAGLDVHPKYE
jgi:hypothetical protein